MTQRPNLSEQTANELLEAIAAELDGEWSPDTLDAIAWLLRTAGYTIEEPQ
jgi:hypothetical protein